MNGNNSTRSIGISNLTFESNNSGFVLRYHDPGANSTGMGIINAWDRGIRQAMKQKDWVWGGRQVMGLLEKVLEEKKP